MKKWVAILVVSMLFLLSGCTGEEKPEQSTDNISAKTDSSFVQTTNTEEVRANEADEGKWPDVIPDDAPKLDNVVFEGYYPLEKGQKEYQVNFSITKANEQIMLDYISDITKAGFVQKYKTDNKFGFDYFGSNDKYDIFMNVIYDGASKISITIK